VRLLRLLQPAPRDWVTKAQRTISDRLARNRPFVDLMDLTRELERDPVFREAFDADPIAGAEAAGWPDLARDLERELFALIALAERIAADAAFRAELDAHPVTTLESASVPPGVAEPFLRTIAMPAAALAKLPDVVAHAQEQEPFRTRILILLLDAAGVRTKLQNLARRA
jgi:hypothetical protein